MKFREAKQVFSGPVNGECRVVLDISREEADELRAALKVVNKYKREAIKRAAKGSKYNIEGSDWHMIEYGVKNDCVIVTIQDGACG